MAGINPIELEDSPDGPGATFDVPFAGRITVWSNGAIEVVPVVPAIDGGLSTSTTPEEIEDAATHLMAAAAWMREQQR